MTILKYQGVVDTFDCKLRSDNFLSIGGVDVIADVREHVRGGTLKDSVTVALADETFTGDLEAWEASRGYGEYTPGDPAELTVGPHNIVAILERYDGQSVTLWIADEPINTLDA